MWSYDCPRCAYTLRKAKDKRFLPGNLEREKFPTAYSRLYRYECFNPDCQYHFIIRVDVPVDRMLQPALHVLDYSAALWNQGRIKRPGVVQMGSTASEFTLLISRDPNVVSAKLLRHLRLASLPIPEKNRRQAARFAL